MIRGKREQDELEGLFVDHRGRATRLVSSGTNIHVISREYVSLRRLGYKW